MFRSMTPAAILVSIVATIPPARAAEAAPADLQGVITAQIEALGRDDGATAQSFASPGIKQKFPDPNQFLAMVKQSYGALIHPRSTHFEPASSPDLGPSQKMTIVDKDGVAWTALYTFEQVDGQWRITGCALLKAPDVGA